MLKPGSSHVQYVQVNGSKVHKIQYGQEEKEKSVTVNNRSVPETLPSNCYIPCTISIYCVVYMYFSVYFRSPTRSGPRSIRTSRGVTGGGRGTSVALLVDGSLHSRPLSGWSTTRVF